MTIDLVSTTQGTVTVEAYYCVDRNRNILCAYLAMYTNVHMQLSRYHIEIVCYLRHQQHTTISRLRRVGPTLR